MSTSLSDLSSPREDDPNSQALSIGCPVRNCWIFGIMFFTLSLTIVEMLCFLLANIGYSFEISKNKSLYFSLQAAKSARIEGDGTLGLHGVCFLHECHEFDDFSCGEYRVIGLPISYYSCLSFYNRVLNDCTIDLSISPYSSLAKLPRSQRMAP